MEILPPTSYITNSNLWLEESNKTGWTHEENKRFERALAEYDKDTPDRWDKVAAAIPGKTVLDVIIQYKELENDVCEIEAGRVPIPGYRTPSFTLEWVDNRGFDGFKQSYGPGGRRCSSVRPGDQERKKGIPWTEDEHRLFLMGLKKHGKGDWRNISRNFVVTRTPTQVASHAQKYFNRQSSGGKDKRRASIHDITTVNLPDISPPSPDKNISPSPSMDQSTVLSQQPNLSCSQKVLLNWNQPNSRAAMVFNPTPGNMFIPSLYGTNPYGHKFQGQTQHREAFHGCHNTVYQIQSSPLQPHG